MYILNITMDECPHIDPATIEPFLARYPEWEHNARRYGLVHMGSGVVYRFPISEIMLPEGFSIPETWPVAGGLDIGNTTEHKTAYTFWAKNPETGVYYLYDEYVQAYEKPKVHAEAILSRGLNLPTAWDYAGNAKAHDEKTTRELYESAGLNNLINADKSVLPGLMKIWTLMSEGKIKIFPHCVNFKTEYGRYRFERGKIRKKDDDVMDSFRYAIMMFDEIAKPKHECVVGSEDDFFEQRINEIYNSQNKLTDDVGGYG